MAIVIFNQWMDWRVDANTDMKKIVVSLQRVAALHERLPYALENAGEGSLKEGGEKETKQH